MNTPKYLDESEETEVNYAKEAIIVAAYPRFEWRGLSVFTVGKKFTVLGELHDTLTEAMNAIDASYTSLQNSIK